MENNIYKSDISYEMKTRYIDYAMSVIIGRAIPDVRDGLKPVHRRILFSMFELGLFPEKGYKKCARIVGEALGKYHPHGDISIYDALVRMAQDFSMRYMLVDGHGNFGSVDGDSAAAMRYTEAKMNNLAVEMLRDINKNTVDFIPNFDGDEQEPSVIPSRFPNLLVNGSDGVAVGMTTSIPSHNLNDVIDAIIHLINNKDSTIKELVDIIKAPDFPTKATIINPNEMLRMYETGKGKIIIRAKYNIEYKDNIKSIVFTEIPYQVNKAKVCENIADLVNKKDFILKNITDIRDESDRNGIRIVVDIKKSTDENKILSQLFKKTKLQDNFDTIMRAIVNNEPKLLNLKEILQHYIDFQKEIIIKRSEYDLSKVKERIHLLSGLIIAIDKIDLTIKLIRDSKNTTEAKNNIIEKLNLDEKQAKAILDLKLQRLTNLDRDNIKSEKNELTKLSSKLNKILNDKSELMKVLKEELIEIKNKYGDTRRTEILNADDTLNIVEMSESNFTEEYSCQIVITQQGYIKKNRKYSENQKLKNGDSVLSITQVNNKDTLIFLTSEGRAINRPCDSLTCHQPSELGLYQKNIFDLNEGEIILKVLSSNEDKDIFILTAEGKALILNTKDFTSSNRTKQYIKLQSDKFANNKVIGVIDSTEELFNILIQTEKKSSIDINLLNNGLEYYKGKLNNTGNFVYNCRNKKDRVIQLLTK